MKKLKKNLLKLLQGAANFRLILKVIRRLRISKRWANNERNSKRMVSFKERVTTKTLKIKRRSLKVKEEKNLTIRENPK